MIRALKGRGEDSLPQSFAKNLLHVVFATKNREPILTKAICAPRDVDAPVAA